jgi:uncharacterized protein (TIGR03086 family)
MTPPTSDFPAQELTLLIQRGRDREAAELGARGLHDPEGTPMDPRLQLREILPRVCAIVDGLDADDLTRPTPCAEFDVAGVLQHMIGGATVFAAAFRGASASDAPPPADDELVARFPAAMADLEAAIAAPGALERTIAAPFGEVDGESFARFVALDGLVHGWDLATSTGALYDPPAEVVDAVAAFAAEAVNDDLRASGAFAAAAAAPDGASALERLVAFTGRGGPFAPSVNEAGLGDLSDADPAPRGAR